MWGKKEVCLSKEYEQELLKKIQELVRTELIMRSSNGLNRSDKGKKRGPYKKQGETK